MPHVNLRIRRLDRRLQCSWSRPACLINDRFGHLGLAVSTFGTIRASTRAAPSSTRCRSTTDWWRTLSKHDGRYTRPAGRWPASRAGGPHQGRRRPPHGVRRTGPEIPRSPERRRSVPDRGAVRSAGTRPTESARPATLMRAGASPRPRPKRDPRHRPTGYQRNRVDVRSEPAGPIDPERHARHRPSGPAQRRLRQSRRVDKHDDTTLDHNIDRRQRAIASSTYRPTSPPSGETLSVLSRWIPDPSTGRGTADCQQQRPPAEGGRFSSEKSATRRGSGRRGCSGLAGVSPATVAATASGSISMPWSRGRRRIGYSGRAPRRGGTPAPTAGSRAVVDSVHTVPHVSAGRESRPHQVGCMNPEPRRPSGGASISRQTRSHGPHRSMTSESTSTSATAGAASTIVPSTVNATCPQRATAATAAATRLGSSPLAADHRPAAQRALDPDVDAFWRRLISGSKSSDRVTTRPDSPAERSPGPMQVRLVIIRQVVLNHHIDLVDMDTAGGHIRRHQRVGLPSLNPSATSPTRLTKTPWIGAAYAEFLQFSGEPIRHRFRPSEHDRAFSRPRCSLPWPYPSCAQRRNDGSSAPPSPLQTRPHASTGRSGTA